MRPGRAINAACFGYFNSRTSCEVRPFAPCPRWYTTKFQLTHLLRGATVTTLQFFDVVIISTHAPLARCDCIFIRLPLHTPDFNSRTSCEVRRVPPRQSRSRLGFQLTHLLRGATCASVCSSWIALSFQLTHLLRGATPPSGVLQFCVKFQLTHLLRGATFRPSTISPNHQFQLTHLLRGATQTYEKEYGAITFQLTHLLRGATCCWWKLLLPP